ncbi:MAG: hypothetical protein Q9209_003006 [Squamulea sp. 1 TL-2023]
MAQISQHHSSLFNEVLRARVIPREHQEAGINKQSWEDVYQGAFTGWRQDSTPKGPYEDSPYNTLRSIRAYLKGDGKFSPDDIWSRHLIVRCLLIEARNSMAEAGNAPIYDEALGYCKELQRDILRASRPFVSPGEIAKMEELTSLERSVFLVQPHPSALHKLKGKAKDIFGGK